MKDADTRSVEDACLTEGNRFHLTEIAARMGVTPGLALEFAINRLHAAFFSREEGELAAVDFGQSLPTPEALGPEASSVSLAGCEFV